MPFDLVVVQTVQYTRTGTRRFGHKFRERKEISTRCQHLRTARQLIEPITASHDRILQLDRKKQRQFGATIEGYT